MINATQKCIFLHCMQIKDFKKSFEANTFRN